MSNSRSKQQCKTKREIRERKLEVEPNSTVIMGQSNDPILKELFHKFWTGSIRHGCNRKYYTKRKVDHRKSERMKQKEEDRKEIK